MPNPSTIAADIEKQYAYHVEQSENLNLSKTSREQHLRYAREYAEELGIEGPPPINGRPAEPSSISAYARNVIALGPEGIAKELERLQSKIGRASRALSSVSTGGMLEAARILSE